MDDTVFGSCLGNYPATSSLWVGVSAPLSADGGSVCLFLREPALTGLLSVRQSSRPRRGVDRCHRSAVHHGGDVGLGHAVDAGHYVTKGNPSKARTPKVEEDPPDDLCCCFSGRTPLFLDADREAQLWRGLAVGRCAVCFAVDANTTDQGEANRVRAPSCETLCLVSGK